MRFEASLMPKPVLIRSMLASVGRMPQGRAALRAALAAVLVGCAAGFVPTPLALRGGLVRGGVCSASRGGLTGLRMEDGKGGGNIGSSLGKGLAGAVSELNKETEERSGKEALFGSREEAIKKAAEADLSELEGGEMVAADEIPIPEPIILNRADFEKTIWRVQVEKSGNWFSGNYCPDDFMVALGDAEDEKLEFGGDPFTRGKWYLDNDCLYIERRPLGALGPFGPGKEYYRLSLTAWATDDNKIQAAGYVSGFSPLFPVAILGRCLITREKAISDEDLKKKIRAAAGKVEGAGKALPGGTATKKRVKIIDLSDDLTEEEIRRKEAAEWVPSTFVDTKKTNIAEKVQKGMGGSLERLKDSVEESIDSYKNIKD